MPAGLNWLKTSRLKNTDMLLVLSVGGIAAAWQLWKKDDD